MGVGNGNLYPSSVRDILNVLFRHKVKIVATFVLVSVLAAVATLLRPDIYKAEAKLLIRLGRENLSVDPSVAGPTVNPNLNRENDVNSELTILTSRHLAEELVDSMGEQTFLDHKGEQAQTGVIGQAIRTAKEAVRNTLQTLNVASPLSPHDKAVRAVNKSFSAQVEKRTNILSAAYEAKSPEAACSALDNLIRLYLDRHIQVYSAQASPDFFETQADALRVELEKREKTLDDFRVQHGISTMDRQKEILLERISALEGQVDDASAQVGATEARISTLRKSLAGRSSTRELSRTTGRTNYAADAMKERLADLRIDETDMSARYPATHRPLVQLREQIKQLETDLANEDETLTEVTTGVDANYETLRLTLENEKAQLTAQEARSTVLAEELAKQKDELGALASRELELKGLTRDLELADQEYRQYREHLQRSKISMAMDLDKVSNVSVVQPACALPYPVRPNKPLDIALGMLAGAIAGIFLAFLSEYLDDSLRTKTEAERQLGVPVLAVVTEEAFRKCS